MSTLDPNSQSNIGWVYPPQPQAQVSTIEEVIGVVNGIVPLIQGQDYVDVAFGTEQPSVDWVPLEHSIFNLLDSTPVNVWPGVMTSKTVDGFRLQLNGTPDSENYYLSWSIRGVFGYYLTGPTSGRINVASTAFTVRLPDLSSTSVSIIVTPTDGGVGGSFTPSTVTLTLDEPSATFTYTPSSYGPRSIGVTNDQGLINPPSIGYTAVASTYTFSGPSTGTTGSPSTNFTVALPVGGAVLGTVIVTPSDGGGGGTFTPTTVDLTTVASSATFTYTAASDGAKTLSVTNNGGLTNPANLTYTASPPPPTLTDNFTGSGILSSHTSDSGHTWSNYLGAGLSYTNISGGSAYNAAAGEASITNYLSASATPEATITIIKGAITGAPEVGMWLRMTIDASNPRGYMGRFSEGSGYQFYRLDTGITFVQLGTNVAGSLANGDLLRFTVSGTGATVTLTLYKNGVSVATITDTSGNRITGTGKIGMHLYDPGSGAGNYRVDTIIAP